jgi:hypothetical protein
MKAYKKFPWSALLHPSIDWNFNLPFSYIWFIYWLIVWEWDDHQLPLLERKASNIQIGFLPD